MLPSNSTLLNTEIDIVQQPSLTYKLDLDKNIIIGRCDGIDAIKQAIIKILSTERYDEIIYSWNYGTEMKTVYGKDYTIAYSKIQDVIIDALVQDDRISNVKDFEFQRLPKGDLQVNFTVETTFGDVDIERRIKVYV